MIEEQDFCVECDAITEGESNQRPELGNYMTRPGQSVEQQCRLTVISRERPRVTLL